MARRARNILAERQRPLLRSFAAGPVLLSFDFDGTLAPIVTDPDRAEPRRTTTRLVSELARRFPVAIISGRAVADLRARLDVARIRYVGNHGVEPSAVMSRAARDVRRWAAVLRPRLEGIAGVGIEDKRYSLAVHFRSAPDPAAAREAIRAAISALPSLATATDGHYVVNVTASYAPTKGDALRRLQVELAVSGNLFVGDDATDEDAFAAQDPAQSLGISVGRKAGSRAPFFVPSQRDIDELLRRLIACRMPTRWL